jgi:two-component system, OmpR family, response regulator
MMERTPHILVVDDHREIRELLAKYLTKNGFKVSVANGGAEMRQALRKNTIHLVVLDIMMPGEDGLSLCRSLRQTSDIPVILLTAVAEDTDRIVGLELGADDYVTKPFNPRELLARVRAILRRAGAEARMSPETEQKKYGFGRWVLDVQKRSLLDESGSELALGSAEFNLLLTLVRRPGIVLSRDQLLEISAGRSAQMFDRSIDNLVSRLRRRIEADPESPALVKTVWGQGYCFAAEVEVLS